MYQITHQYKEYSYYMMHLNVEKNVWTYFRKSVPITLTLFYSYVYCTAWLLSYAIIIHINILKIIAAFDFCVTKL